MLMSEPPDYCRLRGLVTKADDCVLGVSSDAEITAKRAS